MRAPEEATTRSPLKRCVPVASVGALMLYANVASEPGATLACVAVAYRVAESQPLFQLESVESCALHVTLSARHAARSTSVAVPLAQVVVPVFEKNTWKDWD